jgi:hypothetical protein
MQSGHRHIFLGFFDITIALQYCRVSVAVRLFLLGAAM